MRVPLSWLEHAAGRPLDPAQVSRWLTEAGARADTSTDRTLEVTAPPGRPHLASVRGLAAEIRGRLGLPPPSTEPPPLPTGIDIAVAEDAEGPVARVAAARVRLPTVPLPPAPEKGWLHAAGAPLTGTVADLLAYVALETGQPLGAVPDRPLPPDGPHLRYAPAPGEETGGQPRHPDPAPVLRAGDRVLALPARYEHTEPPPTGPADVLLYTVWPPPGAHGTARTRPPASGDPGRCDRAIARAVELAAAWGQGTVEAAGAAGLPPRPPRTLVLRTEDIRHAIDPTLTPDEALALVRRVARGAQHGAAGTVHAVVPPERPDLERPGPFLAEAARLRGHHTLPRRLPPALGAPARDPAAHLRRAAAEAAVRRGLQQISTPVLRPRNAPLAHLGTAPSTGPVRVHGRAGLRDLCLRASLLPGVLDVAARSLRHTGAAHHFETGPVLRSAAPGDENQRLTAVLSGPVAEPSLLDPEPRPAAFADLLGLVHLLGTALGRGTPDLAPLTAPPPHPAFPPSVLDPAASFTILLGGRAAGWAGLVHPDAAESAGAPPARIYCADLDLDALRDLPPVHPRVRLPPAATLPAFHVTVVVTDTTPVAEVLRTVAEAGATARRLVRVEDVYRGERLAPGRLALTVRAHFENPAATPVRAERRRRRGAVLDALRDRGWEGR